MSGTDIIAYCSAEMTSDSGVWTTVEFDTEVKDALNEFNTGTYTYTASENAKILVNAQILTKYFSSGKVGYLRFYKNGSLASPIALIGFTNGRWQLNISTTIDVEIGDTIQAKVYQNYTNGFTWDSDDTWGWLSMRRVD